MFNKNTDEYKRMKKALYLTSTNWFVSVIYEVNFNATVDKDDIRDFIKKYCSNNKDLLGVIIRFSPEFNEAFDIPRNISNEQYRILEDVISLGDDEEGYADFLEKFINIVTASKEADMIISPYHGLLYSTLSIVIYSDEYNSGFSSMSLSEACDFLLGLNDYGLWG